VRDTGPTAVLASSSDSSASWTSLLWRTFVRKPVSILRTCLSTDMAQDFGPHSEIRTSPNVSQQLQFQPEGTFLSRTSIFVLARGLVCGSSQTVRSRVRRGPPRGKWTTRWSGLAKSCTFLARSASYTIVPTGTFRTMSPPGLSSLVGAFAVGGRVPPSIQD